MVSQILGILEKFDPCQCFRIGGCLRDPLLTKAASSGGSWGVRGRELVVVVVLVGRSYRETQNSFSVLEQHKSRRGDRRKAEQDETSITEG